MEEAVHELLPSEIKALLLVECFKNSVRDMVSLLCSSRIFNAAKNSIVWKDSYYKLYNQSDELDVEKPSHAIKLFLRNFLPKDLDNASNNEWYRAVILRTRYDNALWGTNINKTELDRTGWQTVQDKKEGAALYENYKKILQPESTFTYGFSFNHHSIRTHFEDIQHKFHLCFLELTLDRFMADPTEYPITAIDGYHFTKRVNMHLAYSNILSSKKLPESLPEDENAIKPGFNKFNRSEPIFLNSDNVEYTIQPGREWGVYTNYRCEGLFWGKELDELMKTKYDGEIHVRNSNKGFVPRPEFRDFSHLIQ